MKEGYLIEYKGIGLFINVYNYPGSNEVVHYLYTELRYITNNSVNKIGTWKPKTIKL